MKIFLQIVLIVTCISGYSQTNFEKEVVETLKKESIYTETVFIHTNKSKFTLLDVIWFKAYVGKSDNKPSKKTTRLRVELLDFEGEIISTKNIFIFNGFGNGQFELNSTVAPGKYFIRAYTNYMLNFGDDFIYKQEIQVLGETLISKENNNHYDIQIFPEGGYLLENTDNNIAIKALLNGKGISYKAEIITNENEVIATFNDEHIGFAKTSFNYKTGKTYKANFQFSDTLITIQFPRALSIGAIFEVNNTNIDSLFVKIKINQLTLKDSVSGFKLLFHQRNRVNGFVELSTFSKLNTEIILDKSTFFEGVNTVTLFKNNNPIAERKFFVEKINNTISATVSKVGFQSDSIQYSIKLKGENIIGEGNLSVSILRINDDEFDVNQNIKSAFLVSPYVKGFIEKPSYYFDNKNANRLKYLDLLLLTQGWTQYSLAEMIEKLNPKPIYDFELGFTLTGKLKPPISFNELALISNKDELIDKVFLNDNKDFQFRNLLIYKKDSLKISFLKPTNKVSKTNGFIIDSIKTLAKPSIKLSNNRFFSEKQIVINRNVISNWQDGNSTVLKEVLVNGKKRSDSYLRRSLLIDKYVTVVSDIGLYYELDMPENPKSFNDNVMSFLKFSQGVEVKNYQGVENYLTVFGRNEALLYVDGQLMTSSDLISINIDLKDVENIMVQPKKGKRIYQVFTTANYKANKEELFDYHIVRNGFDKPKKYYSPLSSFEQNKILNEIEIDWKPNIITDKSGEAYFKLQNNTANSENIFFFIQGITEDGRLISEIIKK